MSMNRPSTGGPTGQRNRTYPRWLTPVVSLVFGVVFGAAGWAGGHPGMGLAMFVIMALLALGIALASRRSETVAGLIEHRDERITNIDLQATALTGLVLIVVILAAFVVEIARGHSGMPYAWLGAVGGVAYLIAVIIGRVRG